MELDELRDQSAAVIVDTAGGLHPHLKEMGRRLEARMDQCFDRIDFRLGRHGGLIQGGAKAIARLTEWSERVDEIIRTRDQEIAEIRERLKRLENGG
jgi:hypothetical protein